MMSSLGQDVDETEKEEEKSQLLVLKKMDQETGRRKFPAADKQKDVVVVLMK